MATADIKQQDMPPQGGYRPINFKRVPARTFFSGSAIIGGYLAMATGAAYVYYLTCKEIQRDRIEMRSANFAIYPMLLAERDREYLKQLRRNRDEEAQLMANVEGWKVGTYYGEPIFKTMPENYLAEPSLTAYYAHANLDDFNTRAFISNWS